MCIAGVSMYHASISCASLSLFLLNLVLGRTVLHFTVRYARALPLSTFICSNPFVDSVLSKTRTLRHTYSRGRSRSSETTQCVLDLQTQATRGSWMSQFSLSQV